MIPVQGGEHIQKNIALCLILGLWQRVGLYSWTLDSHQLFQHHIQYKQLRHLKETHSWTMGIGTLVQYCEKLTQGKY